MNTLFSSGQFLAFLTILGVGLAYILVTGLLGHIFGGDNDTDGDVSGDNDSSHDTISVFSPKVIALFMVGFGAGGSVATYYDLGVIASTLIGLGSGFALGGIALLGLRLLYGQQASSEISIGDAVGLTGIVTIDIPAVGTGEVGVTVRGQYMTYFAASRGISIPRNTSVKIESVAGSYLIVQS